MDIRRKNRWHSARNRAGRNLSIDKLEDRLLLAGDISRVYSDLDDFRFLAGEMVPEMENAYFAEVSAGATRVRFDLGGQTFFDNNPSDGWSAVFDVSKCTNENDLKVSSFAGRQLLDTYVHDVNLLLIPDWLSSSGVQIDSIVASESTGYTINVYAEESSFEVFTPDDWAWDLPYFNKPIIDISNLRTGFESGWKLEIQSMPYGGVVVSKSSYELGLEVLGREVWSTSLRLDSSGDLPQNRWVKGNYSIALSPQITDLLEIKTGFSGSAHLEATVNKTVTLPSASLANVLGLPGWIVDVEAKPSMEIGVGVNIDSHVGWDRTGFQLNTLKVKPEVTVGLSVAGEANALGGHLAKAGVKIEGELKQGIDVSYIPTSGWNFSAPGSLSVKGSLYWDHFFDEPGGKDLFETVITDWDFWRSQDSAPPLDSSGNQPYSQPTVKNLDPSSYASQNPTKRNSRFFVDATGDHKHGVEYYGVKIERSIGGEWKATSTEYSKTGKFEVGPLSVGNYRLRTFARNSLTGFGYGDWEYFYVPHVGPQAGNDFSIRKVVWTEDGSSNAKNDRDWIAESGEDASVSVHLKNSGDDSVRNVFAYLSTPSGNVDITDDSSFYDKLEPNESSGGTGFDVSLAFPGSHSSLPLTVFVEYFRGNQEYYQTIQLNEIIPADGKLFADFEVIGVVIDDSPAYRDRNNGDGIFQSGEKVRIRPLLKNTGNVAAADVSVEVTNEDSPFVEFGRGNLETYPDIQVGDQAYPDSGEFFRVESIDTTFVGKFSLDLRVWWANENQYLDIPDAYEIIIEPAANILVTPASKNVGNLKALLLNPKLRGAFRL